jgi:hypothetical protein
VNTDNFSDSIEQLFATARRSRQQAEETYKEIEKALKGKA